MISTRKILLVFLFFVFFTLSFSSLGAMHDPTMPPGMEGKLMEALNPTNMYNIKVSGIITRGSTKSAIINGQSVSIGDKISDISIINIDDNSVTFKEENGDLFTVPITQPLVKVSARKSEEK
jgi:hypothetical protein